MPAQPSPRKKPTPLGLWRRYAATHSSKVIHGSGKPVTALYVCPHFFPHFIQLPCLSIGTFAQRFSSALNWNDQQHQRGSACIDMGIVSRFGGEQVGR